MNLLKNLINRSNSIAKDFLGIESEFLLPATGYRTNLNVSDINFSSVDNLLLDSATKIRIAVEKCPPVYSIITRQALAISNGEISATSISDEEKVNNKWLSSVQKLLKTPNDIQSWRSFSAQVVTSMRLYGYCIVLSEKPTGFRHWEANNWWILPNEICELVFSNNSVRTVITGVKVKNTSAGKITHLSSDQFFIINSVGSFYDISFGKNISPLYAIYQNISNIIGIYESKGTLINNRGALGVLSPEVDPNGAIVMDNEEKDILEKRLSGLGLLRGQSKIIVSNAAINWQQIGIPYRDLMFTEWCEDDIRAVCDALIYPYKLLSNNTSGSMNGTEVDSFVKMFYQDFSLPFSQLISEQIEKHVDAVANNGKIVYSFNHVEVLQSDKLKLAQIRNQRNTAYRVEFFNNLMTLNDWNKKNGETEIPKDVKCNGIYIGDKYFFQLNEAGLFFGDTKQNIFSNEK